MKSHKERSKTGCSGCLGRKIKCDEQRPTCRQCVKAGIKCSWDPRSRLHIQKSRSRRKATAHSTSVLEFNFSSAGSRDGCCTSSSTLTGRTQPPISENAFPKASNSEGNDGALLHAPNHDIGRPTDPVHNQYCLNNDLEFEMPSLLSPYIHPPALPCANSILLSHRDRLYLEYFPTSSLVKVLGKTYAWSNFRYICQNKASEEAFVMYAVMALSASEMNQSLGLPTAHNEGRLYYHLALQRIEDTVNSLNCETSNMEAVLGAIFLVITYAWRFGSSISNFQKHNHCLLTCLNIFLRFPKRESNASIDLITCPIFTPFCAQILLWILYIDSSCIGGHLSFELMDYFHMYGGESELHELFTFSRHSYLFIHGQQYPAEQHQDDLENYCPLELIHQDYLFRYRIWRLAERYQQGKVIQSELETLWTEINIIKKAFHDLFQLQRNAPKCSPKSGFYNSL